MTGNASLRERKTSAAATTAIVALFVIALATAVLGFSALDANAAGLKFKLSPQKNVQVGKRTCFKGEVRTSSGNPVKGASISLDGAEARSKKRGKVGFCTVIHWPGKHSALAQKGNKTGFAHFRARSFGVGAGVSGGTWVHQEMQLAAYPGKDDDPVAGCSFQGGGSAMPDFATDLGECLATANPGPDGVFSGNRTRVAWEATPVGQRVPIRLDASNLQRTRYLDGYMTSERERILYISSGQLDDGGGLVETGITPSLAGQRGGPMLLNITLHRNSFGIADGYTFHAAGWVAKFPPKR